MEFSSFIPKRSGQRQPPIPDPPPTDVDATEVNPSWSSTLHRHLAAQQDQLNPLPQQLRSSSAQQPPSVSRSTTGPPAVGLETSMPRVGIRQVPHAPKAPFNPNCAFCTDSRGHPCSYHLPNTLPPSSPSSPKPIDYTDITQVLQKVQTNTPLEAKRTLRYYGDNGGILVVVGYQVHSASSHGVTITPNGMHPTRAIIPWHRVHELLANEKDSILQMGQA